MSPEAARRALHGHSRRIGLVNAHRRQQNAFGPSYGLQLESRADGRPAVRMTVPKCHAGVRTS